MARRGALVAGLVTVLALGGAGAAVTAYAARGDDPAPATDAASAADRPTVEVTRGDLRLSTQVTGTLGYDVPTTVTGRGEGIVTWLPSGGLVVGRGEQLYRVDDAPVAVLFGDLPFYRALAVPEPPERKKDEPEPLQTGHDVDLLATNLAELGLWSGPTTDATYDAALADAVEEWRGSEVLEPGDVVVTDGPVRVDAVLGQVGGDAAGDVVTLTGTDRTLVLQVPPELARQLEHGRGVPVTLADGTLARTTVRSIGGRATTGDDGGPPTVSVTVTPRRAATIGDAALGPVTAEVVTAARADVLQVPITALLALAGGGYAVERPDGALVPVRLGMVAGGSVEIAGDDLAVGDELVVAG
jgi:hypothetical protein